MEAHFAAARKRARIERNMMVEAHATVLSASNSKTPVKFKDLLIDVEEKPRRKQSPAEIKAMLMLALGGPKKNA